MDKTNAVILSVDEITLALFGQHIGEKHDEITEKVEFLIFYNYLKIKLNRNVFYILNCFYSMVSLK